MKQRIISGVVGGAGVLLLLVFRTNVIFNIVIAIALVFAIYEALISTKMVKSLPLVSLSFIYAAITPFIVILGFKPWFILITGLYLVGLLITMLATQQKNMIKEISFTIMMTFIICFAFLALMYLNELPNTQPQTYQDIDGLFFVLIALGGSWFGDIGAYFIGVRFGRTKIAPFVSPKKSLEGLFGGIIFTVIFFVAMTFVWQYAITKNTATVQMGWMILLGLLCPLVGLLGDLSFSYIKRSSQLKDFGDIIPGHGGILDRVDSVILVAPFIYIFTMFVPLIVR